MNTAKTVSAQSIKDFAFPIITLLIILVGTTVFLVPKVREIFEVRTKITKQKKDIDQLSQKLSQLRTLSEAELYSSSNLLLEALPQEKDFYKTLAMTRQILEQNGVFLESFKFAPGEIGAEETSKKKKTAELGSLAVNVNFASSYENFKRMLEEIDKMLPLVRVEALKFGTLDASGSATISGFSGKMNIVSFFSPLPKTLGAADKALPKVTSQQRETIEGLKSFSQYQAVSSSEEFPSVEVGRDNPFSI
jgi:Tfp pilus assembly protein PilO